MNRRTWCLGAAITVAALGTSTTHAQQLDDDEQESVVLTNVAGLGSSAYPSYAQADSTLRHSYSLSPGLWPGFVTSCMRRESNVANREDLCRIVLGYEGVDDFRDWLIDSPPFADDNAPNRRVLAQRGTQTEGVGPNLAVVLANGATYEGCFMFLWNGNYRCDYRTKRHTVLKINGDADSYVLRKMWHWGIYTGNALGCAGGVAGLWYGGVVTYPMLVDCVDGPL